MNVNELKAPRGRWCLHELAELLQLEYKGDPEYFVESIGTLKNANPNQLSFLANPKYQRFLNISSAGIVIMQPAIAKTYDGNALVSDDPYLSFAQFAALYKAKLGSQNKSALVHPTANIHQLAEIDDNVYIGAQVMIGSGVKINSGSRIEVGVVIEDNCTIGADCHIMARVWIGSGTQIGARVKVQPGACLGSDGFGLAWAKDHWESVAQLGDLKIGDDCEIGANTTIDRGSIESTILEADVHLDNQIQIAHNVCIGAHTAIAACTGIAGSTTIGKYCLIGGGCGIGGHLTLADHIELTGMSMVTRSLHKPGRYGSAIPAEPEKNWHRNIVRLRQLGRQNRPFGTSKKGNNK